MSNTLKFGGGTWATKKGSTLAYNDENNNFKPLPFRTTRDSGATRVNKEGLIEVVGNNVPRIDYTDSTDGVLLLENSSTNLVTYSEDFSEWNSGITYTTQNYAISPDGTQNASRLLFTAEGQNIYINTSATGDVVGSIYVKGTLGETIQLFVGGGETQFILNGDWQRIFVEKTSSSNGFINVNTNGGSTARDLLIWGAQLEESSYPTSYIPTSGSTVQRQADTASGSGNSEVFNSQEGVLFLDTNFVSNSGVQVLCSVHDFAANKRLEIWANSNLINGFIGGSSNITVGSSNLINGSHKIALNYKSGNSSFYVDGFLIGSSSTTFTIAELTKMTLGYYNTTQYQSESPTKELGYYDEILTDEELEYMTSYRSLNELVTELNLNAL